ncbi:MAG: porin [Alphaproteobacteria bacterium]
MYRILLGSTAMAMVFGAPLAAAAADKISLSLGGYYRFFGVVGSQDDGVGEPGAGIREHGVAREGEVYFQGKTRLDNGITVGVTVQLEAETSGDQIDESYIWFDGFFGRLELGSEDDATEQMLYGAPTPIDGHGVNSPTLFHAASGANAIGTTATFITFGDRDKIIYFTPRFSGFQLGVSYAPDNSEELGAGLRPDITPGQQSEILTAGINYVNSFGDFDVAIYAGYGQADLETTTATATEDLEAYGFGAEFGYMGFTLGGSYRKIDDAAALPDTDRHDWNIGLAYSTGPWTIAGAYGHGEIDAGVGIPGEDEIDHFEAGVTYALGPGIKVIAGLQWIEFEDNLGAPAAENEAVIGLLGTKLSF